MEPLISIIVKGEQGVGKTSIRDVIVEGCKAQFPLIREFNTIDQGVSIEVTQMTYSRELVCLEICEVTTAPPECALPDCEANAEWVV